MADREIEKDGSSPSRSENPIPRWRAFGRTLRPFRIAADQATSRTYTHQEFLAAASQVRLEGSASHFIGDKSAALWRLEKIAYSYCRHNCGDLTAPDVPVEVQPISHAGLGIAASQSAGFSAPRLVELVDSRAHPDFREYSYESIGCCRALCSDKIHRLLLSAISRAAIPHLTLPWTQFVSSFPLHAQRAMSHGYGRALYFKKCSVHSAIRKATRIRSLHLPAAARGIAFAYAMLNYKDIYKVMNTRIDLADREIAEDFFNGIVYALAFWEWHFPEFLATLLPRSRHQETLIARAQSIAEEGRRAKSLPGFAAE